MTAIDRILLPFALFIIYYSIASWCLDQSSTPLPEDFSTSIQSSATNSELEITTQPNLPISREWLETQSHRDLKAIAIELSLELITDKRFKNNYIEAILSSDRSIGIAWMRVTK